MLVADYPPSVPVWHLRLIPALCGSLLIPTTYQIAIALKFSRWIAALAALLLLLGNHRAEILAKLADTLAETLAEICAEITTY